MGVADVAAPAAGAGAGAVSEGAAVVLPVAVCVGATEGEVVVSGTGEGCATAVDVMLDGAGWV